MASRLFERLGSAFAASAFSASAATNISQIQWTACDASVITNPLVSCGFLDVPLDYHNLSAGNGRIAIARVNATLEPRLGTVFFNPGGPGGSGLENLDALSGQLLNFTSGHYDVISWDPRGIGLSTPGEIKCFESLAEYTQLFQGTIQVSGIEMTGNFTDQRDLDVLFGQADTVQSKLEQAAQRCLDRNFDKLKYVGTAATVRDMVAMADAIQGPGTAINYYGISYGTLVGNLFVNMFPDRVGRVVLDGVVDPSIWLDTEISLNWERFYADADNVYRGFVTGCALSANCSLATAPGQSPAEVNDGIQAVIKAAHDAALQNSSILATSGIIRSNLIYPNLYFPAIWADVADAWPLVVQAVANETSGGNASKRGSPGPLDLAEVLHSRASTPIMKRQAPANDSPSFAEIAVLCGDNIDANPNTTTKDIFENIVSASRNISHMFGAVFPAAAYYCSVWPSRVVERYDGPYNHTVANDILIIGNTFDLITPFRAAQKVAGALGAQASLVRFNAFGHTTLSQPSTCMLGISQAYFTNGTLPSGKDTVCETDEDFEIFPGVNTQTVMAMLPSIGF